MTLHLDDAEVRRLLRLEPLIAGVREALIDLSAGRVAQPLRTVMEIPSEQGLLFLKPVLTRGILATKLITQLPRNAQRSLPTLLATPGTWRSASMTSTAPVFQLRKKQSAGRTSCAPSPPLRNRC